MEQGIGFEAKMGGAAQIRRQAVFGTLFSAGIRMLTRELLFLTHFESRDQQRRSVVFSAPCPSSLVPINLAEMSGGS